jgi:type III secretory pathway component EscS
MQQFKIRQDGFREIKKQMLIRTVPLMLIAVTVGIVISSVNSKDKATDINVLPFVIPFIAVVVAVQSLPWW